MAYQRTGAATVLAMSLASAGGCGGTRFEIQYTTAFEGTRHEPMSTSILGVIQDGRLAEDAWELFAQDMATALQREACTVGFGKNLRELNEDLFTEIESEAQSNGVTSELLSKVASAAEGDGILTLRMYGSPSAASGAVLREPLLMAHRGGTSPAPRSDAEPSFRAATKRHLEISASLFSVRQHSTVAVVSMHYEGASSTEAIHLFGGKMRSALPGLFCTGWNWSAL